MEALSKQTEDSDESGATVSLFCFGNGGSRFPRVRCGSGMKLRLTVAEVDQTMVKMHFPRISTHTGDWVTKRWWECCVFRDAILQTLVIISG